MVGRPRRVGEQRRVERLGEGVRGDHVQAPVVDEGRDVRHQFEDTQQAGSDLLSGWLASRAGRRSGGAGQGLQVRRLGLVQLQGSGQSVEDAVGDAAEVAALQSGVVLDADPGQVGDLAAA